MDSNMSSSKIELYLPPPTISSAEDLSVCTMSKNRLCSATPPPYRIITRRCQEKRREIVCKSGKGSSSRMSGSGVWREICIAATKKQLARDIHLHISHIIVTRWNYNNTNFSFFVYQWVFPFNGRRIRVYIYVYTLIYAHNSIIPFARKMSERNKLIFFFFNKRLYGWNRRKESINENDSFRRSVKFRELLSLLLFFIDDLWNS